MALVTHPNSALMPKKKGSGRLRRNHEKTANHHSPEVRIALRRNPRIRMQPQFEPFGRAVGWLELHAKCTVGHELPRIGRRFPAGKRVIAMEFETELPLRRDVRIVYLKLERVDGECQTGSKQATRCYRPGTAAKAGQN